MDAVTLISDLTDRVTGMTLVPDNASDEILLTKIAEVIKNGEGELIAVCDGRACRWVLEKEPEPE